MVSRAHAGGFGGDDERREQVIVELGVDQGALRSRSAGWLGSAPLVERSAAARISLCVPSCRTKVTWTVAAVSGTAYEKKSSLS